MLRLAVVVCVAGLAVAAEAAELIAPKALQSGWFDGRTISTTGPRGGTSAFTFSADGKVVRVGGRSTAPTQGTWRLDDDGFCMTLGEAKRESCYLAIKTDEGGLKVVRRSGGAFVWTR